MSQVTRIFSGSSTQYVTDSGSAIESNNIINIVGGSNVTTSATGNTITIDATGGGGIGSLDGDTGSASGSTVTVFSDNANQECGSSVVFEASSDQVLLKVTDSDNNTII